MNKCFDFNEIEFIIFLPLLLVLFVPCLRNLCLPQGHEAILLLFSRSFNVLTLLRSMIHLELIFVWYEVGVKFHPPI